MADVLSAGRARIPESDGGLGRAAVLAPTADGRGGDSDVDGGSGGTFRSVSVAPVDVNARLTPVRRPR